jgi:hypothetical protein
MKSTFHNICISLLLCGAITVTVETAVAAPFAHRGAFNNSAVARRAAASSTAARMATVRANNSAPTPAEQLSNEARANASSATMMGMGTP